MREDIYRRYSMASSFERREAHESLEKKEKGGGRGAERSIDDDAERSIDDGANSRKSITEFVTDIGFSVNVRALVLTFLQDYKNCDCITSYQ